MGRATLLLVHIELSIYTYIATTREHVSPLTCMGYNSLVNTYTASAERKIYLQIKMGHSTRTSSVMQASKQQVKLRQCKMVPSHCRGNIHEAGSTPVGL
jgi:hypothetical protein